MQVYPLFLDVRERLIVVVGGGKVASRKVAGVIQAGATRVRVIAPQIDPGIDGRVQRVNRAYQTGDLHGAGLVFAATDVPAVNAQVVADAREAGILVNRADVDDDQPGDFITPAVLRRGEITISVSAGGSPALAARVRDAIAASLDPRWIELAGAMKTLRPRIVNDPTLSGGQRRDLLLRLSSDQAMEIVTTQGVEGLRSWLNLPD